MTQPLGPDDQQKFVGRLARYQLDVGSAQPRLAIPDRQRYLLRRAAASLQPRLVRFTDLATLRRMIGLQEPAPEAMLQHFSQQLVRWRPRVAELSHFAGPAAKLPAPAAAALAQLNPRQLHADDLAVVKSATQAVLAGHPEAPRLEHLAEWFLRAIDFQIAVWPIQDVYVGHGAVLEFDDNVNVLVAGRVTLEPDASVVAHGRFQIDCVILQQN